MSTDEYVPSEEEIRERAASAPPGHAVESVRMTQRAEFDRFLARVRRDAEAELDSWMARAYEAEKRAWQAEARIKAVRDVLDADEHVTKHMGTLGQCRPDIPAIAHDTIRRALDT